MDVSLALAVVQCERTLTACDPLTFCGQQNITCNKNAYQHCIAHGLISRSHPKCDQHCNLGCNLDNYLG